MSTGKPTNSGLGSRDHPSGRDTLRLLTGAFDFAWGNVPANLPRTVDLAGIESLCRSHLAFEGDALYSEEALLFDFEFASLSRPLELLNLCIAGCIELPDTKNNVSL